MEQPDGPESSNRMGVLIEFPGLVRNTTRALERITLGTEHPELSFDPSNEWRPPIKGSYAPALGLVVQVSRDPHTKQIVETRVIGKYNKICRFRKLADFRMSPPVEREPDREALSTVQSLDLAKIQELASALSSQSDLPSADFAPPCLTSSVFPFGSSANAALNTSSVAINEGGKRKGRQAEWTRCFVDPHIPDSPPAEILSRVRRLHRSEYDTLSRLFQERPVWLRSALQHHLPSIGPTEFRAMMPSVAYFFMDGPWRCCWVRYGYDPRRDPAAKIYQVVEMRATRVQSMIDLFPAALRKEAMATPCKHVFDGIHIVANLSQFQYCDLTFPPLQSIVTNPRNHSSVCEKKEGWFVEGTLKKIRTLIKDRWFELVQKRDPGFFSKAKAIHDEALQSPSQGVYPPSSHQNEEEEEEEINGEEELGDFDLAPPLNLLPREDHEQSSDYELYE